MIIRRKLHISNELTVGLQPDSTEITKLEKDGFKTIVNLRRKGEVDQPLSPDEERKVVEDAGMSYVHIPVSVSNMKSEQVDEFQAALIGCAKPVFVHCSLGQRSAPFALIRHALKKRFTADKLFEKVEELNLEWNAPIIRTFVRKYLDAQQTT